MAEPIRMGRSEGNEGNGLDAPGLGVALQWPLQDRPRQYTVHIGGGGLPRRAGKVVGVTLHLPSAVQQRLQLGQALALDQLRITPPFPHGA